MKLYTLLFILLFSINSFSQTNPVPAISIGEPVSPDTVITNTSNEETPAIQIITVGKNDENDEENTAPEDSVIESSDVENETPSEELSSPSISIIKNDEQDDNNIESSESEVNSEENKSTEEPEKPTISIIDNSEEIDDNSDDNGNLDEQNSESEENSDIPVEVIQESPKADNAIIDNSDSYSSEKLIENEDSSSNNSLYKPIISYGNGLFTYFGDVHDNYRKNPVVGRIGYHVGLSRNINDFLELNFSSIHGYLTGNERTDSRYINFQTEILSGGVSVYYNFKNLIKKPLPISPFIALGVEYFDYNSKGDLYDAQGNYYYYWSDGSLRNIDENSPQANNSVILNRDYSYETDLRDLDLDGLGKYQQLAVAIPIDIGFDFPVNKWLTLRFGNQIHFSFSDLIDNVNSKGEGIRQGGKSKDKFMYTYFTLRFNLFTGSSDSEEDENYNSEDFEGINGDEDADGVSDFDDLCPGTENGITVDNKGCPNDSDGDGIADHLDKEANTSKDAYYVDVNGVGKTEQDYENSISTDTIAVLAEDVYKYYPSLKKGTKQFESVFIMVPKKFRMFDINKDEYISPDELSKAIDLFFDFDSNLTIDDIYELNDFFFSQDFEDED
ncbi:MAG: hypothetical protein A2033_03840 [Bacteroidetes bacterium GWA2_31_9]|nr:MAG: hypothetical protein A2033_03840 [Bacteroidetes bacterium GWA2_31_9]